MVEVFSLGQLQTDVYLVTDAQNNAVIIDPADDFDFLENQLKSRNLHLCAILLTHAHFDHTGAVDALRNAFSAPVYIHEADAQMLCDPQKDGSAFFGLPMPPHGKADCLVREGDILTFGEMVFTVLHTPGHSQGSVCYLYKETVPHLFCGDTVFASSCGRCDLYGGNARLLRQSLARIASLPDACVLHPGHGPVTDVATERANNPYIPRNLQT